MTLLLALGWLLALFCAWRAHVAMRLADAWREASVTWEQVAMGWKGEAEACGTLVQRCQENADAALRLADEWKDAAMLMQAAVLEPLRAHVVSLGKVQ